MVFPRNRRQAPEFHSPGRLIHDSIHNQPYSMATIILIYQSAHKTLPVHKHSKKEITDQNIIAESPHHKKRGFPGLLAY
jgi:hypothetical protein